MKWNRESWVNSRAKALQNINSNTKVTKSVQSKTAIDGIILI